MKRLVVPRGAWVLLGLLAIATSMILFGSREDSANPDANSYAPSGLRAFRELLENNGFATRSTRSAIQQIGDDELPIAVFFDGNSVNPSDDGWEEDSPIGGILKRHLNKGGSALIVETPMNFRDASRAARNVSAKLTSARSRETRLVTIGRAPNGFDLELADRFNGKGMTLWTEASGTAFSWIDSADGGKVFFVNNGLGLANRFVDQQQNARTFLEIVRLAADNRQKIVFLEASHAGAEEPSIVEVIGPWAMGAWWQLTLGFIVLACSWGVRFGMPPLAKTKQQGGREIAEALADLYGRAKASEIAMEALYDDADRQIRRRLKIAGDTPDEVRDRAIPESLAYALNAVRNASLERAPTATALAFAQRLDREMTAFVGARPANRARRKRS